MNNNCFFCMLSDLLNSLRHAHVCTENIFSTVNVFLRGISTVVWSKSAITVLEIASYVHSFCPRRELMTSPSYPPRALNFSYHAGVSPSWLSRDRSSYVLRGTETAEETETRST